MLKYKKKTTTSTQNRLIRVFFFFFMNDFPLILQKNDKKLHEISVFQ